MEKIGKYELREILGRGGMGIVYRAYDPVIDREVAVKIIQEQAVLSPELKARFVREARTAGKFSHDNITVFHDLGEIDGKLFIVMEFLQGRDLRSIIDKREPLSLLDKLNYARQICKGLRYAHANGIVHRDIKPENVKVLTDGRIKIMDFGIAKPYVAQGTVIVEPAEPVLTQMGMRIGTPWYMSPEQVKGAPVDKRSDIFSFGVLFYELLTYQKPFTGDDTTVLYKILHEEPEPIHVEESGLGASLQQILSRCLAKSPDERYADCLLILRDLEKVPGGAGLPRIVPELLREAEELDRQQRPDEAQQKFTEILEVDPGNPIARASIERLTVLKGEQTVLATASAEQTLGEKVGHFRIMQRISGGAMGVVYKAEDLTLRRIVALKFLALDWTQNPDAKKRFLKEAQAASALDHPNVCTVYEVGETPQGLLYLCMAYYEGEDLSARIRQGQLSLDQALYIVGGVARGLGAAHAHGILHRDIKPANILITRSNEVKIVDFGIAKLSTGTQITRAGSVVGTLPYMSPEQIRGLELDQRGDIWSLAVVLYQALAGKVPFDDSSESALFDSIVNQDHPPITSIRKDLPPRIDAIFAKALAKNREDRYATTIEFLRDLESLSGQGPASTSPTGRRLEEVAALVDKGKAHMRRKEYDEAIMRFEAALRITPKDLEIQALRAECLKKKPDQQKADALVREAEERLTEGKPREARKRIQSALALDPEHEAAARLLERVVAATAVQDAVDKEMLAGEVALKRQLPAEAAAAYRKVLELQPANREAQRGLERLARGSTPARKAERPVRASRTPPRNVLIGGAAAAVVVVVVGLWMLLTPSKPGPPRAGDTSSVDSSGIVAAAHDLMLRAKNDAAAASASTWVPSLLYAASDAEKLADRAEQSGFRTLARKLYDDARASYTTTAAEARRAQSAAASGVEALKTLVADARQEMLVARRTAEQAGAKQRAASAFNQSVKLESEGNAVARSTAREDLLSARNLYTTAREGFDRATKQTREIVAAKNDADAELASMRRTKLRIAGSDAEKQANAKYRRGVNGETTGLQRYKDGDYKAALESFTQAERSFAESAIDIAAGRVQQRAATETRKETPATETAAREPERKDPAARDREEKDRAQREVRRMLEEYRQAIEQGDVKGLGALLNLNPEGERKWSLFFNNTDERKVSTELVEFDAGGGNARVSFRWKISFQSSNTPQSQDVLKHWELQSENGTWKIVKEK